MGNKAASLLSPHVLPSGAEEAARDVAKAVKAVRPVLLQYEKRYDEVASRLSRARADAATATREARDSSHGHLRTMERLGDSCAALGRDLAAGEHGIP